LVSERRRRSTLPNAAVSTATLGFVDQALTVSAYDRSIGYNWANGIANVSVGALSGAGTGALARGAGWAGKAALAYDASGNALDVGRGTIDAYNQGGLTVGNSFQIAAGAAGFGGNAAGAASRVAQTGLPKGIAYTGSVHRAVSSQHVGGAWDIHAGNIAANHRYSGPGRGALYTGTSTEAVLGELKHYGIDPSKVAWVSQNVSMSNVLDLTSATVRKQLGVSLKQLRAYLRTWFC
jgi:filamentous hemagglutinin